MHIGYSLVQALAIVAVVGSLSSAESPTGVLRLDPDYTTTVDQWWAVHPFNPESPKYLSEIRSPSPVRELKPGDSIQDAIDALPASGGTLKLAKGTYSQFQIVGRSHVHIIADQGATILGRCRVASSNEAMDYGDYDRHVSKKGQRLARYWELHKNPTRDYYFRNLTFDDNNSSAVQVTGENVLVTRCEANGQLRYFGGSDPRWADSDHNLAYKFYGFQIASNRVGQCREALLLSRNLAPISCPPDVLVPCMGKATVRRNVIESCPQLLKEVTLPHSDFRKEGARTASFEGPNVLENNAVAGKNVAKGDCP